MFYPEDDGAMPQPKQRGGMFGGALGGKAPELIMAVLAGLNARRNPQMAQAVMGMMQQKRQQALEEQQYQHRREDQRGDWLFQQQYKAEHDQPEMGEFERALMASGVQPGTPGWADAMKRRANNMLDPIVMLPQGPVPRSLIMGNPGPPTQPVGSLTPIPDDGGPTAPPSGGFRF